MSASPPQPAPEPRSSGKGESSKERYARAVAARKAREDQERAAELAARKARAEAEAAAFAARGDDDAWTPVLAPPDPNKPASRAMLGILGAMALITGLIAVLATILS